MNYTLDSYADDWRHYDGVADATYQPPEHSDAARIDLLKLKEITNDHPDYLPIGSVGSDSDPRQYMVWNASDEVFAPEPDGVIDLDNGGSRWVRACPRKPHGYWIIATQKQHVDTIG